MIITAAPVLELPVHKPLWVFGPPREKLRQSRRALPLRQAANGDAIAERVANAAQLDAAMRQQLVRVLTVTVQDWMRK